jgi:hypothetical protein
VRLGLLALALVSACACATAGPFAPRFTVIYQQNFERCRLEVLRDGRSSGCFLFLRCGREWRLVTIESAACVP